MIGKIYINDFIKNYINEYKDSIKNDKYLNKYYDKLILLIEDTNNDVIYIDIYKNAKDIVSRELVLKVANTLNIHFKENAIVEYDISVLEKSGYNKCLKIIDVSKLLSNVTLKNMTNKVLKYSVEKYTNNIHGYILITNIDTNISFELGKKGIDKTLSKNVPIEKIPTIYKLKELCEQAIYFKTSYNEIDNNGIKYHHFIVPVKVYKEGNAFVRIVVKEYTKQEHINNKFYYHQIEYLPLKKEVSLPASLLSNENQAFESTSYKSIIL